MSQNFDLLELQVKDVAVSHRHENRCSEYSLTFQLKNTASSRQGINEVGLTEEASERFVKVDA